MSNVTDIILITGCNDGSESDDDEWPNADKLGQYLTEAHNQYLNAVHLKAGGDKYPQHDVFMSSINHLDIPTFLAAFRSIRWEFPDRVRLILCGEQEDDIHIYRVDSIGVMTKARVWS